MSDPNAELSKKKIRPLLAQEVRKTGQAVALDEKKVKSKSSFTSSFASTSHTQQQRAAKVPAR